MYLLAVRNRLVIEELAYHVRVGCGEWLDLKMPDEYRLHWVPDFDYGQPGDVHLIDCEWTFYDSSRSKFRPIDQFTPLYVERVFILASKNIFLF